MEEKIEFSNDNLNVIFDTTFTYAKELARDFYFNIWVKNPPRCPAFNGEIIRASHDSWEHIVHDESKTRMDIPGRLFILERAKKLLQETSSFQDYEIRNDIEYWIFNAIIQDIKIRVIIRSIKNGPKHFLSVIRKGSVMREINENGIKQK